MSRTGIWSWRVSSSASPMPTTCNAGSKTRIQAATTNTFSPPMSSFRRGSLRMWADWRRIIYGSVPRRRRESGCGPTIIPTCWARCIVACATQTTDTAGQRFAASIVVGVSEQRTIRAALIIALPVALGVIVVVIAAAIARIDIDAPGRVARIGGGYAAASTIIIVRLTLDLLLLIGRIPAGTVVHRAGRHALRHGIHRLAHRCVSIGIQRAAAGGDVARIARERHA